MGMESVQCEIVKPQCSDGRFITYKGYWSNKYIKNTVSSLLLIPFTVYY